MIGTSIWRSKRFRALTSDSARLTYLYLHTTSHGNSLGAFVIPPEMAALDRKRPADEIREDYLELQKVGLIAYDPEEELLLIHGFYKFNAVGSRKHLAGPIKLVASLPDSPVKVLAVCGLIVALFERWTEWRGKIRRYRATGKVYDTAQAVSLTEASAGFVEEALNLLEIDGVREAFATNSIGLPIGVSEGVCIDLSIGVAIQRRQETETNTNTNTTNITTTDNTTTTDTTTTTNTPPDGSQADAIQIEIAAMTARSRSATRR